jgi:hypothetical protein
LTFAARPAAAPAAVSPAPDVQAANNVLTAEQLLVQFYNANAQKSYLTLTTTPAAGTPVALPPSGATGSTTGTTTGTAPTAGAPITLTATLGGAGEVPAVNSAASATASFTLSADQQTVSYAIQVMNLSGPVTAIRIREGAPGVAGGIDLYDLNLPVNGVSTGAFTPRSQDIALLVGGNTYLEIATAQNPAGEIRGQLAVSNGTTSQPGNPVPTVPVTTPATTPTALTSLIQEIRNDHNAHVATLQQDLGASAAAAPAFQSLDAPTLAQFLTMAITLEDFAVGVDQNAVTSLLPASSGATASPALNGALDATLVAILADNARHAGGLRGYRKVASPDQGGDVTSTLTQNGTPFNTPILPTQMSAFLQPYLATTGGVATSAPTASNTGTSTGTGTTPGG